MNADDANQSAGPNPGTATSATAAQNGPPAQTDEPTGPTGQSPAQSTTQAQAPEQESGVGPYIMDAWFTAASGNDFPLERWLDENVPYAQDGSDAANPEHKWLLKQEYVSRWHWPYNSKELKIVCPIDTLWAPKLKGTASLGPLDFADCSEGLQEFQQEVRDAGDVDPDTGELIDYIFRDAYNQEEQQEIDEIEESLKGGLSVNSRRIAKIRLALILEKARKRWFESEDVQERARIEARIAYRCSGKEEHRGPFKHMLSSGESFVNGKYIRNVLDHKEWVALKGKDENFEAELGKNERKRKKGRDEAARERAKKFQKMDEDFVAAGGKAPNPFGLLVPDPGSAEAFKPSISPAAAAAQVAEATARAAEEARVAVEAQAAKEREAQKQKEEEARKAMGAEVRRAKEAEVQAAAEAEAQAQVEAQAATEAAAATAATGENAQGTETGGEDEHSENTGGSAKPSRLPSPANTNTTVKPVKTYLTAKDLKAPMIKITYYKLKAKPKKKTKGKGDKTKESESSGNRSGSEKYYDADEEKKKSATPKKMAAGIVKTSSSSAGRGIAGKTAVMGVGWIA